jgi:hypothetical protein
MPGEDFGEVYRELLVKKDATASAICGRSGSSGCGA